MAKGISIYVLILLLIYEQTVHYIEPCRSINHMQLGYINCFTQLNNTLHLTTLQTNEITWYKTDTPPDHTSTNEIT